jgi:hypothetical protein
MLTANIAGTELQNLIWASMESVAEESRKCSAYLEKQEKGLSNPHGLSQQDALKLYRQKLVAAMAALDEVIS